MLIAACAFAFSGGRSDAKPRVELRVVQSIACPVRRRRASQWRGQLLGRRIFGSEETHACSRRIWGSSITTAIATDDSNTPSGAPLISLQHVRINCSHTSIPKGTEGGQASSLPDWPGFGWYSVRLHCDEEALQTSSPR